MNGGRTPWRKIRLHGLYISFQGYIGILHGRVLSVCVAMILDSDRKKVLLVRLTYIDGLYLPGGGVKKFEEPEAAAGRELREELGLKIKNCELFGVYSNYSESKSDTVIVLLCDAHIPDNTARSREIHSFGYYSMRDLPADTSPGTRRRIEEYLANKAPAIGKW